MFRSAPAGAVPAQWEAPVLPLGTMFRLLEGETGPFEAEMYRNTPKLTPHGKTPRRNCIHTEVYGSLNPPARSLPVPRRHSPGA